MRMISKVTAALGSLILAGIGMVGFATSASATATTVSVTCSSSTISFTPSTVSAVTGDTITVSIGGPFDFSLALSGVTGVTAMSGTNAGGNPQSSVFTVTGTSGGSITFTRTSGTCAAGATGTFTFTGSTPAPSGGSTGSTAPSSPAPVLQQFGKPATGTCADAAAATLNWAGVANGGWGESWSQWMNGGKGGAVCNRALIYSLGLSKWVVNAESIC